MKQAFLKFCRLIVREHLAVACWIGGVLVFGIAQRGWKNTEDFSKGLFLSRYILKGDPRDLMKINKLQELILKRTPSLRDKKAGHEEVIRECRLTKHIEDTMDAISRVKVIDQYGGRKPSKIFVLNKEGFYYLGMPLCAIDTFNRKIHPIEPERMHDFSAPPIDLKPEFPMKTNKSFAPLPRLKLLLKNKKQPRP